MNITPDSHTYEQGDLDYRLFKSIQPFVMRKECSKELTAELQTPCKRPAKSRIFDKEELNHQTTQALKFDKSTMRLINDSNRKVNFEDDFEVLETLGIGSYGEVFRVRSLDDG
jgi:hypothetical protein